MKKVLTLALLALSFKGYAGVERECYQSLFAYGQSPEVYSTSCDAPHMTVFRVDDVCVAGQEAMCNNPDVAAIRLSLTETFAHWFWTGNAPSLDFDIAYTENQKSNGGVRPAIGKSLLAETGPNSHTLGVTEAWWTDLAPNNWEAKHDVVALEYARMALKERMGREKYRSIVLMPDGSQNPLGMAYFEGLALTYASLPSNSGNVTPGTQDQYRFGDFAYRDLNLPMSNDDFNQALSNGNYFEAARKISGLFWSLSVAPDLSGGVFEDFLLASVDALQISRDNPAWFDIDDLAGSVGDGADSTFVKKRTVDGKWIINEMPGKLPSNVGQNPFGLGTPVIEVQQVEQCAYGVRDGGGGAPGWGTLYRSHWDAVSGATVYYYCGRLSSQGINEWAACHPTKGTVGYYPWLATEGGALGFYACNDSGCERSADYYVWDACPN